MNIIQVHALQRDIVIKRVMNVMICFNYISIKIPKKEKLIIMGDVNAKIELDYKTWAPALGKCGLRMIIGSSRSSV